MTNIVKQAANSRSMKNDSDSLLWGFVLGFVLFIGGFIGFFWGLRRYLLRRLILNTPTSTVEGAAIGLTELIGKADTGEPLISPVAQAASVYWQYKIEEERTGNKGRKYWVTLKEDKSDHWFYLTDQTGSMLINPEGAEIHLPENFSEIYGGFLSNPPPPSISELCRSTGIQTTTWLGINKRLKFSEWTIAPGDPLYVLGNLQERADCPASRIPYENLFMGKGGSVFFISDNSEKGALNQLFWSAIGGTVGGGIAILIGAFILLNAFGLLG